MAETVTISTFLELRDNMSEGLKRIADALQSATQDAPKAQAALNNIAKQATANSRQVEKAKKDEERAAARAAEMRRRIEINSAKSASDAAQKENEARIKEQHRIDSLNRSQAAKDQIRRELNSIRAEKEAAKQIKAAEKAAEKAAAAQERMRKAAERSAEKETRKAEQLRVREAKALQKALDKMEAERKRYERQAEALARKEANAAIREAERVAREKRRIDRETAAVARRAERDRLKMEGAKPAGGLFGTLVGAGIATNMLTSAASRVKDLTVDFFNKVKEEGANYEKQTSAIAGSIFTRGIESTYSKAENLSRDLMRQMVELAAKLPGEASDYIEVFSRTLPSALSSGQKDMKQFVDFISKYTALAVQQGKPASVAATQMTEMLQGHVRVTTSMYQHLSQFTGKSAKDWNDKALPAAERLRLAMEAINKASAALPATAMDAVSIFGTLKTAWDMMFVVEGAPLFESQKIAARELADLLSSPMIKDTMHAISEGVGNMLVGAIVFFKFMFQKASEFVDWTLSKISNIPGMGGITKAFKVVSDLEAFVDPFKTMYRIGEEERKKWQAQQKPEITMAGGAPPPLHATPNERAATVNDFRYSRFDIRQEFAEGFDPDRIAVAFATDLGKLADRKLSAATGGPAAGAH